MSDQRDKEGSIIDSKAMGGLRGLGGYRLQATYAVARLPQWLERGLQFLHFEGDDDLDLEFENGEREYHQVKRSELNLKELAKLTNEHVERHPDRRERRFVVATPHPRKDLIGFSDSLRRYRAHAEASGGSVSSVNGKADLESRMRKAGFDEEALDFTLRYLDTYHDFGDGREAVVTHTYLRAPYIDVIRKYAGQMPSGTDTVLDVVWQNLRDFLSDCDSFERISWDAIEEKLRTLATMVSETLRQQPTLHIHHDSVRRLRAEPDLQSLPARYRSTSREVVHLEHCDLFEDGHGPPLEAALTAIASLVGEGSELQLALRRNPDAAVVYWGLPHIPLAATVGARLQGRTLAPIDKQHRGDARLGWHAAAEELVLRRTVRHQEDATSVRLRVSVSFLVAEESARRVAPDAHDVHVYLEDGTRGQGVVRSWEQYESLLDQLFATSRYIAETFAPTKIHIFASVPVSIALALGRAFGGTMFPPTWVYDFKAGRYVWGAELKSGKIVLLDAE